MGFVSTVKDLVKPMKNLPLRRPDGDLVTTLHPYRRMLSYVLPGRNESVVYYDDYIKADKILPYIQKAREKWHMDVDITHCLVAAVGFGLYHQPKMNQFIAGKRLYKRNHIAVTFSVKRKRKDKEAKLAAVKLRFDDPEESLESICRRINDSINVERSGTETRSDRELGFFFKLPRPVLSTAMWAARVADANNLLPKSFIEHDAFFTSMFIANLGSLGMRAGFHHLYEYGTCSLFMMVGEIEDRPVVVDGEVVPQKTLHLRWTYDERIDDGLTSKYGMREVSQRIEDPEKYFGPL